MGERGMSAAVVVCRPVADLLVERKRGREWENAGVRRSDSCGDVRDEVILGRAGPRVGGAADVSG
jgi:hypothetical protein